MVKPAASPADEPRRTPSTATDKPKSPSTLQPKFAALLAAARLPGNAGVGQLAYFAHRATHRVETGHGAIKTPTARPPRARGSDDAALVDPLARSLAVPSVALASPPAPNTMTTTNVAVNDLAAFEEAVRRVAWGGDRRRGVARIELGGEYAGTAIVVRGEGREVAVRVEVPRGSDARDLPARLVERLEARGLRVIELEVR
jgi:hypothetical protein